MPYPAIVERLFDAPEHVGPQLAPAPNCRGEAGAPGQGAWVVFEAAVEGGVLRALSFRAFGCPYVIAACSRVAVMLNGAPVRALLAVEPPSLAAELEVPPEKFGRLLVIQDALRNCFADWDTTQPAGARQGAEAPPAARSPAAPVPEKQPR